MLITAFLSFIFEKVAEKPFFGWKKWHNNAIVILESLTMKRVEGVPWTSKQLSEQ